LGLEKFFIKGLDKLDLINYIYNIETTNNEVIMKSGEYYYYKVDVMSRSHGYSFMVRCKDELSDDEVISRASKADCFEDDADSDNAYVDTYLVDSDIRAFKDCTTTV